MRQKKPSQRVHSKERRQDKTKAMLIITSLCLFPRLFLASITTSQLVALPSEKGTKEKLVVENPDVTP